MILRRKLERSDSNFRSRRNPFHAILLLAGAVFVVAACSTSVLYLKQMASAAAPSRMSSGGDRWLAFMDQYGGNLLVAALALLVAAALADFLWERFRHPPSRGADHGDGSSEANEKGVQQP